MRMKWFVVYVKYGVRPFLCYKIGEHYYQDNSGTEVLNIERIIEL